MQQGEGGWVLQGEGGCVLQGEVGVCYKVRWVGATR